MQQGHGNNGLLTTLQEPGQGQHVVGAGMIA